MINIIWSDQAKQTYFENIDYLLAEWTEKEAIKFMNDVEENLFIIKKNPKTFAKVDYRDTRSVVITPQITLFYNILNKSTIELIVFWNNYKEPKMIK